MKKFFDVIKDNPLFEGIAFSDFEKMLDCLSAKTKTYKKSDIVLLSGDSVKYVGLLLSGSLKIIKEDINGNTSILAEVGPSEIFAEVFACAGIMHSPVTILASEDSLILFLDFNKITTLCSSACLFHSTLIKNMLKLIAAKTLKLNQKIEILSKRSTREKLLCYFDFQRGASKKFSIPFNREELASYLCVDRSAMSNELSKMQNEGLIRYKKNLFEVL